MSSAPQIQQDQASRFAALASRALPSSRIYIETSGGVQLPPPGRGRRYWIVSRGLCRFFRVELLGNIASASQRDAINLEIKRFSPFAETGSWIHLSNRFASVWLWDQAVTRAAGALVGVDVDRMRVVPEPAMLPRGDADARLIEGVDGYEGQYWSEGGLSASRWWPRCPDQRAWLLFQRGASVSPEAARLSLPAPLRLNWIERPWTRSRNTGSFDISRLDVRLLAASGVIAILLAYGYQGASYLHARLALAAQQHELAERANAIEPVLTARTQALGDLAAIEALRSLNPFPSQLAIMAQVAEMLPADGAHLDDWLYDRGQLELSIASDKPLDIVGLVRSLQASGTFKDVAAERTGNNNTLRLHASVVAR